MKTTDALISALMCAALAGCTSLQQQDSPAPVPAASTPLPRQDSTPALGAWFNPPAEFPGICMNFGADGQLEFRGGFVFFNPGRWWYDSAGAELRIELGGTAPFPAELAKNQVRRRPASLLRFDAARRTLVYRLDPGTEALDFGGFSFYRKLACIAAAPAKP